MKTISFELTMPNVGSWNGKWTGADRKYYVIRKFDNKIADKLMENAKSYPIYGGAFIRTQIGVSQPMKSYYYNFGDGWGANVILELIDAKEGNKRKKLSSGFQGYEWMIDSIISHDEILTTAQRRTILTIQV